MNFETTQNKFYLLCKICISVFVEFQDRTIFLLTDIRQMLKKITSEKKDTRQESDNDFRSRFTKVSSSEELDQLEIRLENEEYRKSMVSIYG